MPPPIPLTACAPPKLDWSRPEAPAAEDFGDIYFSVDGGLAETEAVYLAGCGLPGRWEGRKRFAIGELGFGSGLNFLAAWRMWDKHGPNDARLDFVSVEKFPFDQADLKRALSAWPELSENAARLIALWPGPVKGTHKLHLAPDITLTLLHDDVLPALSGLEGQFDAWFLDGFSPAKNPAMWSEDIMAQVGRLSAPGATIGTFTVAGSVRAGLKEAGFSVEKKEGFGRKRQRLEAVYPGAAADRLVDIRPVIIGGGIAGASLARAFLRRGIVPTLIDPGGDTAASSNPVAIVKPRLDLQDRAESRFFLESYLYALQAYEQAETVLSRGVFHAAKTDKDIARFRALAAQAALPEDHMTWGGGPYDSQGLLFPKGLVIDPAASCAAFTKGAKLIKGHAVSFSETDEGMQAKLMHGETVNGSHIFLTIGADIRDMDLGEPLGLRYSRGQITLAKIGEMDGPDTAFTYGGYAVPSMEKIWLGATHARLTDDGNPHDCRAEDDQENIDKFKAMSGIEAVPAGRSRASVRVTQANTLPMVARGGSQIILTGLGSRGFVFAPLLAEDIVARILEEPHVRTPFWRLHDIGEPA